MPKEITHWLLVEAVSKRLETTFFGEPLRHNANLLHIGAILHDAPYYYIKGDFESRFGSLPTRLHGTVDDAAELVESLLRYLLTCPEQERTQLTAFLVGLVTHLFGDALMHPLIFYLTGPYDSPDLQRRTAARQDHRMLESLIDMCMTGGYRGVRGYSLASYIRKSEMPLIRLHEHLDRCWLGDEDTERFAEGLLSSFRLFAFMQSLYRNRLVGRLVSTLFSSAPPRVREILALVYLPRLMSQCWRIEGDITYQHPSTGKIHKHSIRVLFRDAVDRSVEFCLSLERLLAPGVAVPDSWSLPPVDPSLGFERENPLRFYAPGRFFD
jgi:hypothetical protein